LGSFGELDNCVPKNCTKVFKGSFGELMYNPCLMAGELLEIE
jgi:hypothetical protein